MEEKRIQQTLQALMKCEFGDLWTGKDFDEFLCFIRDQAVPYGQFLITLPVSLEVNKEGLDWFCYRIKRSWVIEGQVYFESLYMGFSAQTSEEKLKECPERWKGLPVWRYNLPPD